jgi:hypothetical protein
MPNSNPLIRVFLVVLTKELSSEEVMSKEKE